MNADWSEGQAVTARKRGRPRTTHCYMNHQRTPENTTSGGRCRPCGNATASARYRKRLGAQLPATGDVVEAGADFGVTTAAICGARLRRFRVALGLRLVDVAEKIGVSAACIGAWEQATREIRINRVAELCAVYKITLAQAFTGPLPPEPAFEFGKPGCGGKHHPKDYAAPVVEPPTIRHGDQCDTFEPELMCEECREILNSVIAEEQHGQTDSQHTEE